MWHTTACAMPPAQCSNRIECVTATSKKNDARVTDGCTIGRQEYRAVTRGSRNACARGWLVYQRDTEEMNANKRLLAQECVTK